MTLVLLTLASVTALTLLIVERLRLDRSRENIPLVIAVTGTRGKSTVTRMLASVLRCNGQHVLAKTTGSEAVTILPDGSQTEIRRRGYPSIIEQKHLVHQAAELGVDAVVVEIMSIHAENHWVEGNQLLRPNVVAVTNLRIDHTGAMGNSRRDVEATIMRGLPSGARVVIPKRESSSRLRTAVAELGGELMEVPPGAVKALPDHSARMGFSENFDLVAAVAGWLDVDDEDTCAGMAAAQCDIGALGVWRYQLIGHDRECLVVNAFAVNDPESTALVHGRVMRALGAADGTCVGFMNLRADRGDRTVQWAEALAQGELARFKQLYLHGLHANALKRRLARSHGSTPIKVLRGRDPADVMRTIGAETDEGDVVFGFGNIGGIGEQLVRHWRSVGETLEV